MWVIICIALGGLAVDGSNAWRTNQMLRSTADVAAHAGAMSLMNGGTQTQARTAAVAAAHANMPTTIHGDVLANPTTNISFGDWDEDDQEIDSATGSGDVITVVTRRDAATNSKLTTFFLRFVGFNGFSVRAQSSVTYQDPQGCDKDGIFAHGMVQLDALNTFASEYCVHSQDYVWMPQQNTWALGTTMSMPDLDDCGDTKCIDSANPGIEAAMGEATFDLPSYGAYVTSVIASFDGTGSSAIKDAFFDDKERNGSVGDLAQTLQSTEDHVNGFSVGTTINLTESQYEQLGIVPGGLNYVVTCPARGTAGGPSDGKLLINLNSDGSSIDDVAIVTDCKLLFDANSVVVNSAIMTSDTTTAGTPGQAASVSGRANAHIGLATSEGCQSENKTTVLTNGDIKFAASVSTNNVSIISGGDIHLASSTPSNAWHTGSTFYADGEIHVTTQTNLIGCPSFTNGSLEPPQQKLIRFVYPEPDDD